jgi:hypothetical protein
MAREKGVSWFRQTDGTDTAGTEPRRTIIRCTRGDTEFRGIIPGRADEATEKLGLQRFTALMTVVSAVTAFYFGTNFVKAATASAITVAESGGGGAVGPLAILQPSRITTRARPTRTYEWEVAADHHRAHSPRQCDCC